MWYIFWNGKSVSLNSLIYVARLQFRFNNYKSTHRKFRNKLKKGIIQEIKKSELKQKLFHEHYCSDGHEGIANWCVTLIDQVEDKKELRKKELYWINKLNTWAPVGLNVREVYEAYWIWTFCKAFLADKQKGWKCFKFIFIIFLDLFILLLLLLGLLLLSWL